MSSDAIIPAYTEQKTGLDCIGDATYVDSDDVEESFSIDGLVPESILPHILNISRTSTVVEFTFNCDRLAHDDGVVNWKVRQMTWRDRG